MILTGLSLENDRTTVKFYFEERNYQFDPDEMGMTFKEGRIYESNADGDSWPII